MIKRTYHCPYLSYKYNGEGQTIFGGTVVNTLSLSHHSKILLLKNKRIMKGIMKAISQHPI